MVGREEGREGKGGIGRKDRVRKGEGGGERKGVGREEWEG